MDLGIALIRNLQLAQRRQTRAGRAVEFDRNLYLQRPMGDIWWTFTGEELRVIGKRLGNPGIVSARATFVDAETSRIDALHEHWGRVRDGVRTSAFLSSLPHSGLRLACPVPVREFFSH